MRPQIYQLFLRSAANPHTRCIPNGSLEQNGCGKFDYLTKNHLESLSEMGFSHLWITGLLQQASSTPYAHRPPDDPLLLKGKAGSPYAITDYYDICADYALAPEARLEECFALTQRCKEAHLSLIMDFVPNHVARSYHSLIAPETDFGKEDDRSVFFSPDNNFYYLQEGLTLPTPHGGRLPYPPENPVAKVTGNNCTSSHPSIYDWYETAKLNYGIDFTKDLASQLSRLPSPHAPLHHVPNTWKKMDAILAYWQQMGISGFRVDMAHMVPIAYWAWQITRARQRDNTVFFMAEAYDSDPAKLHIGNVTEALLQAGFNATYHAPGYHCLKGIIEGALWANDLDRELQPFSSDFHYAVRYTENHDEVRLASTNHWAHGSLEAGLSASALLFGISRGPLLFYNGQETGETGDLNEGFSQRDGRSSIFDYTRLSTLQSWLKNPQEKLPPSAHSLRLAYQKLLCMCKEPAFSQGDFFGLNYFNRDNPLFAKIPEEPASGHYLYAYLRRSSQQAFLVLVHLAPHATGHITLHIPHEASLWLGAPWHEAATWELSEQLHPETYSTLLQKSPHTLQFPSMHGYCAHFWEITPNAV